MLFTLGIPLALFLVLQGSARVVAQDNTQTLRVSFAVCPPGYSGDDLAEDCGTRLARAFTITVFAISDDWTESEAIAREVVPNDDGEAAVDITGRTPGVIRVLLNTTVGTGNKGVGCTSDGSLVPASIPDSPRTDPLFDIEAPVSGNVDCVVYTFGSERNEELLDVITLGPNATASGNNDEELIALPNTGTGAGLTAPRPVALVALAGTMLLTFIAGVSCLQHLLHRTGQSSPASDTAGPTHHRRG
jgi:hypothetical protein